MKLINPSAKILKQESGLEGIYKQIELAGRTCYRSEDKITDGSAKLFVDRMIKSGHTAMLEHGTVYLYNTYDVSTIDSWMRSLAYKYRQNKFSKVVIDEHMDIQDIYVTTNLRVIIENGWQDDLQYLCEPTEYHERRITFNLTCDRGVSHELVRHKYLCVA